MKIQIAVAVFALFASTTTYANRELLTATEWGYSEPFGRFDPTGEEFIKLQQSAQNAATEKSVKSLDVQCKDLGGTIAEETIQTKIDSCHIYSYEGSLTSYISCRARSEAICVN